jgi:hypothetical protein
VNYGTSLWSWLRNHSVIREHIAESQVELGAQAERDDQHYSMTRRATVELLIEIISSPPKRATLDNPLCEARYVGQDGQNGCSVPGQELSDTWACWSTMREVYAAAPIGSITEESFQRHFDLECSRPGSAHEARMSEALAG